MGKTDNKIINAGNSTAGGKTNTDTESTGKKGRGRPRKDGGPTGRPTEEETATDIPRLVLVDIPESEETDEAGPAAPKNPTKRKRKDIQYELKKEQLSILIKTVFDIAGSREGLEVWKLSQKEADLIAEPLSALLNKNPIIDKITSEYGDYIALFVALATVLLPRLLLVWTSKKKTEKGVKPYLTVNESSRKPADNSSRNNESPKNGIGVRESSKQSTAAGEVISTELYSLIPVIQ